MKKYIFVLVGVFLSFVFVVNAQQIDGKSPFLYNRDLSVGKDGLDVMNLQGFLIVNGYDIPAISSGAAAKGYFGSQTRAALIKYQLANGLPGTGYFGPLTRAKFNGNNPGKSLNVTAPNGGEVWLRNSAHSITWTGAPGILSGTGTIKVAPRPPACAEPRADGGPICMIAVRAPYVLGTTFDLSQRAYNWGYVGSYVTTDLLNDIPDGDYKIEICSNGSNTCDSSDNYFTITTKQTTSQAPNIGSIDAPQSLKVGETGTWKVYATDPQNSQLTFTIDWGDTHAIPDLSQCPAGYTCNSQPQYLPTAPLVRQPGTFSTFTHAYNNPGTYTVYVTIKNTLGLTAQVSTTVNVDRPNLPSSPAVTSPNGGEVWTANSTQTLKWNTLGLDPNTKVDLYLDQTNIMCITTPCGQTFLLDKNIPLNQIYNWIVATDINNIKIMPADYKFRVCLAGTTNQCDSSDSYFTIKAQTSY